MQSYLQGTFHTLTTLLCILGFVGSLNLSTYHLFAELKERQVVVVPRRPDHLSKSRRCKLTILKTLEFSSQTLRSGVVVLADDVVPMFTLLFLRGAPGIIKDLLHPSSVPANFDQVSYNPRVSSLLFRTCSPSHMHNVYVVLEESDSQKECQLIMTRAPENPLGVEKLHSDCPPQRST